MKNIRLIFAIGLVFAAGFSLFAQNNNKPCPCCKTEFRQFDFWLGDWEAFNKGDTLLGTNKIAIMQDSCVIQENWTSASPGYTGTSYNFYDSQSGKWRQTWIDNQGGSLLLSGGLEDGKMVLYSGKMKTRQGRDYINRITWTPNPDGSVRQHWETSSDDGKNWTTAFDGLYKKRKSEKMKR